MLKTSMFLKIVVVLMVSVQVWGSQGISINDQILTDYRNAKSFREFVEKLTKNGFPGDHQYIQQVWKTYPELLKDKALPKLIFEKGQFVLREGPSEIKMQKVEGEFGVFVVNGNKLTFGLYDKASQKMKKIMTASRARKTAHFALMPVVWAADAEGVPSKLQIAIKALVSVLQDEEGLPRDLVIWQRAENSRFLTESRESLNKNVGDQCLGQIESVERTFAAQRSPFISMKCDAEHLDVSLQGFDQDKKMFALNIAPDRLVIRRAKNLDDSVGLETYRFNRPTEDIDSGEKGYKDDEAVSDSSSPFQRDMNFQAASKTDQAGVEYLDRFINIAGNPEVRNLCGVCGKQVTAYTRIVDAYEAKTLQLRQEKSGPREKVKSTK